MQYRLNTTVVACTGMVVVLAIGLFAYTYVTAPTTNDQPQQVEEKTTPRPDAQRTITAKHQYEVGLHTLVGSVNVLTSCNTVVAEPFFLTPSRGEVEVRFSEVTGTGACEENATATTFKVTFEGPENLSMSATWNGAPVTLNLVPARAGENLNDFAGDIKG